ncbi:HAD family hydrolase [Candidatus Woesearchaeota archaeon]|nr:HAD family hydrolase [Candidatus Woesearchaeota archaeon]
MGRLGSLDSIPDSKKLIIFDFLGTTIESNTSTDEIDSGKPRKGIEEVFKHYKNQDEKYVVIASDTNQEEVEPLLNGLGKLVDKIYYSNDVWFDEENWREIKNLQTICEEYKIPKEETIMIGDSVQDLDSAQYYGIEYILIPLSEVNPEFNFKSLIPK